MGTRRSRGCRIGGSCVTASSRWPSAGSDVVPDVILRVVPERSQTRLRGPEERVETVLQDPLHIRLLAEDKRVPFFDEDKICVPVEAMALADLLRNDDLTFAGHAEGVHDGVRHVLLLNPSHQACESEAPE